MSKRLRIAIASAGVIGRATRSLQVTLAIAQAAASVAPVRCDNTTD